MNFSKIFAIMSLLFSMSSFGQGAIFSTVDTIPEVLHLKLVVPYSGDAQYMHMQDDPMAIVSTVFAGIQQYSLQKQLIQRNVSDLYCTGKFEFGRDKYNSQLILIQTIKVCLDGEGNLVAHSFDRAALTPEEIAKETKKIDEVRALDEAPAPQEERGSEKELFQPENLDGNGFKPAPKAKKS